MIKSYQPTILPGRIVPAIILAASFLFSYSAATAQVKDSTITGIYTNFKTYWATSTASNSLIYPDTSHNLLGFVFRGKTYSTGVNDATLNTKLGSGSYSPQVFKALPVRSIAGNVTSGTSTYIATAIKNDGDSTKLNYASPYPNIRIADVLTDGKNGLDLGTGVTNLPKGAHISFSIKSLSTKASTDSVPDLVFTQIADPSTNNADTIFFYDANGNIVGNKKLVYWNAVTRLGTYKLDLYTLSTVSCNTSSINGGFQGNGTRDIRMVAFLLTEFGITNADSAAKVKGIQINPNGTSDQAFIAYNTAIMTIDVPVINTQPQMQTVCSPTTSSVTFSVSATSSSNMVYQWKKNGASITGANAASYTATGLTLADTVNSYTVTIGNNVGTVTSDPASVKYVIVTQPASLYLATGAAATFTVKASGATAFQWQKDGVNISGATSPSISRSAVSFTDSGTYRALVSYAGGTCTSNDAVLRVESLPAIVTQPQAQVLCTSDATTATFSVAATSISALSYQWYKNGIVIPGATASSYSPAGLIPADTSNVYRVVVTNGIGSVPSSTTGFKYLLLAQPSPASAYLATGNTITFTSAVSSVATGFQWKKNGADITGAHNLSYKIDTVTTASAGTYTLSVLHAGGACLSNEAVLSTSVVLYSKPAGNISDAATWGVQLNGTGSTPVNFDRAEHTFVVANRDTAVTGTNLNIAGTYDVANGTTLITGGTRLEAGRIIRSLARGTLAGNGTAALTVHGKSDLYFAAAYDTLQMLTVGTTDTVVLHTALNITGGSGHGTVTVTAGVLATGDSLTLKSDSIGTAAIGNSAGTIVGKVTVERFIPARRAWRLFSSPVSANGAPAIHDAWQEGALHSTDNPHPGFGTHITYGATENGFDQNPQKSFSMKVLSSSKGSWIGVPTTRTTRVTDYPAFMFFIRGNRSYDITSTATNVTPLSTILRTTGYLNQGTQANVAVADTGFTLVGNPFASPIDFASLYQHSQNIANRIRIWNPNLGGSYGTGAYVLVYWNGSSYSTVPNLPGKENLRFIQANQGFFVESNDANAFVSIREADKDSVNTIIPFGRLTEQDAESKLEVNLKVFNTDQTTGIADGVAYLFGNSFNKEVDEDDIVKMTNTSENLGILSNNHLLTIEQRPMAVKADSLYLNMSGVKTASYQLELIPAGINSSLYLFDKYLNTLTPVSATDTSRFTISVNTAEAASKAGDRFTIVLKPLALLPVTVTRIAATVADQVVQVEWSTANESGIRTYDVEKSTNGNLFSTIGQVTANSSSNYRLIDQQPAAGTNYYRVKITSVTGAISYTSIANAVYNVAEHETMSVYPNPLTSQHGRIELHNKTAGKYTLTLINSAGHILYTIQLSIAEGNSIVPLTLPASLAKGTYQLQLSGNGKTETTRLITLY